MYGGEWQLECVFTLTVWLQHQTNETCVHECCGLNTSSDGRWCYEYLLYKFWPVEYRYYPYFSIKAVCDGKGKLVHVLSSLPYTQQTNHESCVWAAGSYEGIRQPQYGKKYYITQNFALHGKIWPEAYLSMLYISGRVSIDFRRRGCQINMNYCGIQWCLHVHIFVYYSVTRKKMWVRDLGMVTNFSELIYLKLF